MSNSFEIITSIRSDLILRGSERNAAYAFTDSDNGCQFYLLSLHRDRLVEACEAFGRSCEQLEGTVGLLNFKRQLQDHLDTVGGRHDCSGPLKLRISLTKQGNLSVSASPVPTVSSEALFPRDLNDILTFTGAVYCMFVSAQRMSTSLFTRHKTTNRGHYDQQRALLPPASSADGQAGILHEMLLVNQSGAIMEGTISTPYFYRNGGWVTPSVACGGHLGVARRWALTAGICTEGVVMAEEVVIGEQVILSNGVRGFGWGKVKELGKGWR